MGDITLILGGIKTGKTGFAQQMAMDYDRRKTPVVYLATAQPFDHEMKDRIERHKLKRPPHWQTIEEPLALTDALNPYLDEEGVILLDCLTLWLTNLMSIEEHSTRDQLWSSITGELGRLCDAILKSPKDLIIITNQVEYGLVSEHAFARLYQDMAGLTHQYLAKRSQRVYSIIAGLHQCLKNTRSENEPTK